MTAPVDLSAAPAGLARRFAALIYDGALLFGVIFFAGILYAIVGRSPDAVQGHGGEALWFFVPGLYFVYFWTRSGQTLAMKTWHLRVVDTKGRPLRWRRAAMRYLLVWLCFLPGGVTSLLFQFHGSAKIGALVAGVLAYVLIARLHPQRQFLHDTICGSRVVTQLPQRS